MRRIALVASLAVAALSARAFAEDELKTGWTGFGVGSFVHQKSTSTTTGPGIPAMPASTSESKQVLTKVTDDAYLVKTEVLAGGSWTDAGEIAYPRRGQKGVTGDTKDPVKIENLGEESLTVDGTSVSCKKQRATIGDSVTTTWTNDKLGVMKSETAAPGSTMASEVTKLAGKTTIGGVEVAYQETVMTSKSPGATMKMTTWASTAVPGGSVRSESATEMEGGMKTSVVTETIAFEKK